MEGGGRAQCQRTYLLQDSPMPSSIEARMRSFAGEVVDGFETILDIGLLEVLDA